MVARMADYFAVLDMAAKLADDALDLPWGGHSPVSPLYEDLVAQAAGADKARVRRALLDHAGFADEVPSVEVVEDAPGMGDEPTDDRSAEDVPPGGPEGRAQGAGEGGGMMADIVDFAGWHVARQIEAGEGVEPEDVELLEAGLTDASSDDIADVRVDGPDLEGEHEAARRALMQLVFGEREWWELFGRAAAEGQMRCGSRIRHAWSKPRGRCGRS